MRYPPRTQWQGTQTADLSVDRRQKRQEQAASARNTNGHLTVMIVTNTTKLLMEAPHLVKIGIERGWLSYPKGMKFHPDGTPDPVMHAVEEVAGERNTPEMARKAYYLRERGLSLNDVAAACQVPRGSVVYLISKGHEMYLASQREKDIEP